MVEFFQKVWQQLDYIQFFGVFFSVLQVIYAKKNNPKNYLFGIVGVSITLYVMFVGKLYAEFTLNIYYLVMSIYGWFFWKYGKNAAETPISYSTQRDWFIAVFIVLLCFGISYPILSQFTDSDVPLWDASVAAFAWAGMWLMAKRKMENWILLNCSNILAIPLMFHKGYDLYGLLSIFLFVMAILGYIEWKKIIKNEQKVL